MPGDIPVMSTQDVGVFYNEDHAALSGVSLRFPAGQVAALIGPSGCGKSTYLRCLNLMNREIPHCRITGSIRFRDQDITRPDQNLFELRMRVGMVFQQPNPFRKSVYENIALAPRHHGMRIREDLDALVEESLRAAALWDETKDKLHHSAYMLSGGQQQRLCIARTLALKPDVVLMDEPCSALDPISTNEIEKTIRSMAQRGICVIIVTHNMQQAARISDTTAFFYVGSMVESGPTRQIFDSPRDARLQDYITGRFG